MVFVLVQKERERETSVSVVRRIFVLVQKRERETIISVGRRIFVFVEEEYSVDILRGYCSNEIQDSVSKYENK